ncbi:MAG: fluoride efflux transporter CrcB [Phyllobacteriaceae bacterium]|nr:fluoride efflux transporter CrcB [Phyllobacteriaceae bacterium]
MWGVLWVALGGAIGSAARHGVNIGSARLLGTGFPSGTLTVNVLGSFFMGFVMALLLRKFENNDAARLFLTTGILGGFTTFSAFSLDVFNLMQRGESGTAIIYVLSSVLLSVGALFAGFAAIRMLT